MLGAAILLAVATTLFLPALHVRGTEQQLLGLSAWQAVPILTSLKLLALVLAIVVVVSPSLARYRAPALALAACMIFAPAAGALMAGVSPGTDVRNRLVELSGNQSPWVDPGWGLVVLPAALLLLALAAAWGARRNTP
ncbi:hypothetical protein JYK14_22890 [Siccirubricoccus sp. KC 17139]|uniref:Uncharacterized protein n=1 Tax=Siccirubricoccus soli TaxID=2899147 RepID=A0ABT1DBM5_9PROT|nr:hypothetical protein [Siccirubricoccus soli]MCO6418982.1 hypothetical protein [Siccirubricoccus soli]MCP2685117.1 hypothetical protein [Siccirubricoccus soli]